jgi:proteasome assembly chaperone (PAC2) family protein
MRHGDFLMPSQYTERKKKVYLRGEIIIELEIKRKSSMKMLEKIAFPASPILIAAWPGMGNVGIIATDYLRRKLDAKVFAEIDMSPYFIPDSIIVKDGIAQLPEIPSSIFHYSFNPNIIIFESNAQIGGRDGISIIKTILEVAKEFKVSRIYTAAALVHPMTYQSPSQVLVSCSSSVHLESLLKMGAIAMPDGYIAGLNGLLLGVAASHNIDSACFLGTMPSYASNMMYPKASIEIVKTFSLILSTSIDLSELEASVTEMDQQFATIEERIRQIFPQSAEADEEISGIEHERVPHYIMERIEKLFEKAKTDRKAATELKEELDRWNLYELYENRFLDLFEDDGKNSQTGQ